jgi:hypothetical protein
VDPAAEIERNGEESTTHFGQWYATSLFSDVADGPGLNSHLFGAVRRIRCPFSRDSGEHLGLLRLLLVERVRP